MGRSHAAIYVSRSCRGLPPPGKRVSGLKAQGLSENPHQRDRELALVISTSGVKLQNFIAFCELRILVLGLLLLFRPDAAPTRWEAQTKQGSEDQPCEEYKIS